MDDNPIELGGNITLSGFQGIDGGSMIILKKIIGNCVRRISDKTNQFEKLNLHVKNVHSNETNKIYELQGKLINGGEVYSSEISERNIFVAVDSVLKKMENSIK